MPRFKNSIVTLPDVSAQNTRSWESINAGFLMDLRDELQEQNRVQGELLRTLQRMDRRLREHLPLKRGRR